MRLLVEADGGSRGNPGPAGYGAVVRNADTGEVLAEVAEAIGVATNNVAEYRGLIAGLRAAAELSPRAAVEVRMDSKLVVEQMSGRWRIKHPDMLPLASQARQLAAGFGSVRYGWIPRERNGHADRLANEAMDAAAQGRSWSRSAAGSAPRPREESDQEGDTPGGDVRAAAPVPEAGGAPVARAAAPGAAEGGADRVPGWIAATTPPTSTLLLRHGETPLSAERRFAGTGDIPLTEHGIAQARAAAEAVRDRVDVIITSPMKRTRQTAGEVAAVTGAEVHEDEGFREMDFGRWEGLTFAEARQRWPAEATAWLADPTSAPPGGESMAVPVRRVREAKERTVEQYRGRRILVVTHVTPIKTMVRLALLAPVHSYLRMHLDVACLTAIDWYDDGSAVLNSLNDTAHLDRYGRQPRG